MTVPKAGCASEPSLRFEQCHIDVARYATDDFNPFHDPHRWERIRDNPYGGPIVLGFQLEGLIDHCIELQRRSESPASAVTARWSSYELRFAGALRPGDAFSVQVRRTLYKRADNPGAGIPQAINRVVVRRADGGAVLLGSRTDAAEPRVLPDWAPMEPEMLREVPDRAHLPDTQLFVKRKYLNTSNGKNFLLGALVDPHYYFDELSDRVMFPPIFTASLLSCALLERGRSVGYDFERDPQVYVAHRISIDRRVLQRLRSNDRLDLVVEAPHPVDQGRGLSNTLVGQDRYRCLGVAAGHGILLRAEVQTAPLHALLGA